MCKKNCDNEDKFHCLQKKITKLEIYQDKLVLKNKKNKCNQNICTICSCSNGKYEYLTDTNERKNLCKYCVDGIKKAKHPKKSVNDNYCNVCNESDGRWIIKNITICLCSDCLKGIQQL